MVNKLNILPFHCETCPNPPRRCRPTPPGRCHGRGAPQVRVVSPSPWPTNRAEVSSHPSGPVSIYRRPHLIYVHEPCSILLSPLHTKPTLRAYYITDLRSILYYSSGAIRKITCICWPPSPPGPGVWNGAYPGPDTGPLPPKGQLSLAIWANPVATMH